VIVGHEEDRKRALIIPGLVFFDEPNFYRNYLVLLEKKCIISGSTMER
jgi:hypothetical protein